MNENIDLTKILKDCPKGTKLYSPILGDVIFERIDDENEIYPIRIQYNRGISDTMYSVSFTKEGKFYDIKDTECIIFPSKEQRNWANFTAPWYKKERFDPKTLNEFDRVIYQKGLNKWRCDFFSSYNEDSGFPNVCIGGSYQKCIPYNDETKHIIGTTEEAPEYYRYWED